MITIPSFNVILSHIKDVLTILGAIGGLAYIRNWLKHLNVTVYDCKLERSYPRGPESLHVTLSWRIHNKPRLWKYGEDLIDISTKFFIGRGDKGEWHWTGDIEGPGFLPIKEKTYQSNRWINEEFPMDKYRIYFKIFSKDKVIKTHYVQKKIIEVKEPEFKPSR